MNDQNDIADLLIISTAFKEQSQHELLATLRSSVKAMGDYFGIAPTRLQVSNELYTDRLKFMEKAINEMGLTIVVDSSHDEQHPDP